MIQKLLFAAVLIYASVTDIRRQTVPTHIHVMLGIIGMINLSLSSIVGFLGIFIPLLFVYFFFSGGIGAGDVKIAAMSGFVIGLEPAVLAFSLGILICSTLTVLYCLIERKQIKGTCIPIVPFISLGCLMVTFF